VLSHEQLDNYSKKVFFNYFFPSDMFHLELAKDELQQRGYSVLGGYMSPVNDAYKKKVMCGITTVLLVV
jgi:hypothetical protein